MAASINGNDQQSAGRVGLLVVLGDVISNEQRDEVLVHLKEACKRIDTQTFAEVHDLFNNLIHSNEFQYDAQYRQVASTENGSFAGFLYQPGFHTVSNVFKDLLVICQHVCFIFCGQQVDSNGALILIDSFFTSDNMHSIFEDLSSSYVVQDFHLILPLITSQWSRLSTHYLQKHLRHVHFEDLSIALAPDQSKKSSTFGQMFYERIVDVLSEDSVDFDLFNKLKARDSSGTIAFDEPNLYILYGQQGEASLFGIRGFVVLINGGFSRIPSYWNLIRGVQSIDACILTHFDYDVLPGLQSILHRKTIPSPHDGRLCKPDIGAIFLNHVQRTRLPTLTTTTQKVSSSNSKLLVNLTQNIDQFLTDIKHLNIDTFDLVKHISSNKQSIEPINLYKKIAFGSLDLYCLHPTTSMIDDDKALSTLQKIPIRDQQPSPSIIPLHHWYSACMLLVWTPSSKANKDSLVRVLYTGACPQTIVFEALGRVRHLEFLHESQQQPIRAGSAKTAASTTSGSGTAAKQALNKPKAPPPPPANGETATASNKTAKAPSRTIAAKPKVPQATAAGTVKANKPRSAPAVASKKATAPTSGSPRLTNKDKNARTTPGSTSKSGSMSSQGGDNEQKLDEQHQTNGDDDEQKSADGHHESSFDTIVDVVSNAIQKVSEVITGEESTTNKSDDHEHETTNEEHELSTTKRPESVSFTVENSEALVESTTTTPLEEIKPQLGDGDPMTTSFVDGAPNTRNPFTVKNDDDEDPIEIVHHDLSTSNKYPMPSIDEIHPQGLPMDETMESVSKKTSPPQPSTTIRRSSMPSNNSHANGSNRSNGPTTNIAQQSSRKSKHAPAAGPIFYVDVAYIPYHGDEHYVDSEFFRRIRARYYILNAVQINRLTLESLLDGKQQWDKKEQTPVTLVPTFDGDQLRQFFVTNKTRLAELNINILPASTRCNVQYDDEGSPAQRLRFSSMSNTTTNNNGEHS